ncbi:MAG: 4'-phosphopantetheinyl transferase superfamily protein [Winogradskyella sp.]
MIGNDVVDLKEAKLTSNWQRPRFLDKLFTTNEQRIIKNSDHSFLMVWRLWSMKEASYKLYTQLYPSRFYAPNAFQCDIENSKVSYKDFQCFVKTEITAEHMLSEACLKEQKMTSKLLYFNYSDTQKQSKVLKAKIIKSISETYQVPRDQLRFYKNEFGTPMVKFNSEYIHVSLSHHGNYGVFAISHL